MATFANVDEIKAANSAAGLHFFEPASMRFFDSRVLSGVYGGRFFVTSERFRGLGLCPDGERLYTVRVASENGAIATVGEVQEHRTAKAARAAAIRAAAESC